MVMLITLVIWIAAVLFTLIADVVMYWREWRKHRPDSDKKFNARYQKFRENNL